MNNRDTPRVTVLTQVLGGGTGMQIRGIYGSRRLAEWHRECVVLGEDAEPTPAGTEMIRLPAIPEYGPYPIGHLRALRAVRRHLRANRPDVLHTYFFWPILFGRFLKARGYVDRLVENREDEGFDWGRHEYTWLRATGHIPDRVVCVSRGVQEVVRHREGLEAGRVHVIYNGIAEPRPVSATELAAAREDMGLDPDRPVVGMVANLNRPVKGADQFLEAVARVIQEDPSVQFLLVGGSRESSELRRRVERLDLAESIRFAGFRDDVTPFYELMDVSILTSLSEGLSITLLESMGHALPVVVTRVGGNPEVVVDGTTGYLVPPRDPAAMAERILRLVRDPDLRTRMGRQARERYLERFTLRGTASAYAELLESLAP